jgi:VanZ family protein
VAFGALDEVHQGFVPGRSQDAMDWVADAAGAALAVVLWPLLVRAGRWFAPPAQT